MTGGKPEPYVVYWPDHALLLRLAKRRGCETNDIDPSDYWTFDDFNTLAQARAFLSSAATAWDGKLTTVAEVGGWIEKRVNIRRDKWAGWDWEQERVDEPAPSGSGTGTD